MKTVLIADDEKNIRSSLATTFRLNPADTPSDQTVDIGDAVRRVSSAVLFFGYSGK